MIRRSFIANLVKAVAATAVAAKLVREADILPDVHQPKTLEDHLLAAAEMIQSEIYWKHIGQSPWNALIAKATSFDAH